MSEFTLLLARAQDGDAQASEDLLPLVYGELRRLAAYKMASEAPGQTLQPTALVHEAWLRLTGNKNQAWNGRTHFFNAAAEAMRRILIDTARRKHAQRRGGGRERVELDEWDVATGADDDSLLALNDALEKFSLEEPDKAELVKLRFFVGMNIEQAAEALSISPATAKRNWAYARAWLYRELEE
jgi:RNA polymerase sigma factor (TIGR02999 family)